MFAVFAEKSFVSLILRLGLAVIFIYHGWGKVAGEGNGWGAAWMKAKEGETLAPPLDHQAAQLAVAWGELIGGLAIGLGFLTRIAAAGLTIIMAGAIYTATWQNGFSNQQHGFEYNFALIVMCVALVIMGGGTLSVDAFRRSGRKRFLG